jgi:hypothetical protein
LRVLEGDEAETAVAAGVLAVGWNESIGYPAVPFEKHE